MLSNTSRAGIAYYEQSSSEFHRAGCGRAPVPETKWLVRHLPVGSLVVDAGCGTGEDTAYMAAHGLRVYAYDASLAMVRLTKERVNALPPDTRRPVVACYAHHELRFEEPAAGVLASASLLFLEPTDLERTLRTLACNLAPGGYLLASFKRGAEPRPQPDGRTYFDREPEELQALAAEAGLQPGGVREQPDSLGRTRDWVTFIFRQR